jgi:hypothetical protein
VQSTSSESTARIEPNTYQTGQSSQASTVSAASTTKLALDKEFGDSHSSAVDRFLLSAAASTTAMFIKELGSLGHCHTDHL